MEDEQKLFKWNTHHTTFNNAIRSLRYKGTYTDVTLACDGKFYPLHKFVLAISSEYFCKILESINCTNPVIIVTGIQCLEMELLIDYMYTGEVNIRKDKLPSFMKAAQAIRMNCLELQNEEPISCQSITEKQSPLLKAKMTGEDRSTSLGPKIACTSPTQSSKSSNEHNEEYLIPQSHLENTGGAEDISSSNDVEDVSDTGHHLAADISDHLENMKQEDESISDYDDSDLLYTSNVSNNSIITESLPDDVPGTNSPHLKRKRTSEDTTVCQNKFMCRIENVIGGCTTDASLDVPVPEPYPQSIPAEESLPYTLFVQKNGSQKKEGNSYHDTKGYTYVLKKDPRRPNLTYVCYLQRKATKSTPRIICKGRVIFRNGVYEMTQEHDKCQPNHKDAEARLMRYKLKKQAVEDPFCSAYKMVDNCYQNSSIATNLPLNADKFPTRNQMAAQMNHYRAMKRSREPKDLVEMQKLSN